MTHLLLCVLCFLECGVSLTAVRYGEYPAGHMPQYHDQHEGDAAPGPEEYGDRSPDAPAPLDYKYEEEPHGKSDDLPVKDIVDDRIWDKPIKKKRKPSMLRGGHNRDLDKFSLDDTEPEVKSDRRFAIRGSQFKNRNYGRRSDSQKRLQHAAIGQSDDIDNVENDSDYVLKQDIEQDIERADGDDIMEVGRLRYRPTTRKKQRRKPRDRGLDPREWRDTFLKTENDDVDSRSERESFENTNPRRFSGKIQESMNRKNKNNDEYDEYYDMKRVQHMKSRLPALLKQTTVRTTEAKSTGHSEHWLNRRADSPTAGSEPTAARNTTTTASSTLVPTTTKTTRTESTAGTELSLAEKSRLSILKKAQRKESSRNVSASTKPPVLLQVTRRMQTLVMVERRGAGAAGAGVGGAAAGGAGPGADSPERLRRARQLVRHKLVAGARSIHDLIDNWDEMVCDYIDVSLLDTDAAPCPHIDTCATLLLFCVSVFTVTRFC